MIVNLANGTSLNGPVNESGNAAWLRVNLASGGLTLNGPIGFNGFVVAPLGTVIVNGAVLTGGVVSDRLIVNNGRLSQGGS